MTAALPSIPFYLHDLGEAEIAAVSAALRQPILTTGEIVEEFERRFAERLGVKHALAVTSCTGALHMALLALDIGPGDEVITTPMTFVATAAAIASTGAKPVFVDVEVNTGNIDVARIEAAITSRTKAIMPVHLYGQMCDMVALDALASKYGLKIIEDAAHCVEGERDRLRPGSGGSLACFSFYATKNLTCGEGGAITTNDDALYQRLRLLRLHGMSKTAIDRFRDGYSHWDMVAMGWKYNMSNIEAAILLPQFDRMDSKLAQREKLASLYEAHLAKDSRIRLFDRLPGIHARHVFTIRVKKRDEVIASLQSQSIGAVVNYRAVHLMSYFQELLNHPRGSFPNAEAIGDQVLSIPFYPQMPEEWVGRVSQAVRIALDVTQSAPFESL